MQITTFRADTAGGSAFSTVDIAFPVLRHDEFGHAIRCSQPWVSPAAQFVELPAGMDQDWHNAPARQVVVVLAGCDRSRDDRWPDPPLGRGRGLPAG